jgi:hypothetical protein
MQERLSDWLTQAKGRGAIFVRVEQVQPARARVGRWPLEGDTRRVGREIWDYLEREASTLDGRPLVYEARAKHMPRLLLPIAIERPEIEPAVEPAAITGPRTMAALVPPGLRPDVLGPPTDAQTFGMVLGDYQRFTLGGFEMIVQILYKLLQRADARADRMESAHGHLIDERRAIVDERFELLLGLINAEHDTEKRAMLKKILEEVLPLAKVAWMNKIANAAPAEAKAPENAEKTS